MANQVVLGRIAQKRGKYLTRERVQKKMQLQFFGVMIALMLVAPAREFYLLGKELDLKIQPAQAQEEISMRDWVLREVEEAGIDKYRAYEIINCESKWNDLALNKNKDGSFDIGLWQLNEKWQPSPRACKLDYKCATAQAIKLIKKQGFKPWTCNR
jgi:hypothetical protein